LCHLKGQDETQNTKLEGEKSFWRPKTNGKLEKMRRLRVVAVEVD
jgi:hypothetical protein